MWSTLLIGVICLVLAFTLDSFVALIIGVFLVLGSIFVLTE